MTSRILIPLLLLAPLSACLDDKTDDQTTVAPSIDDTRAARPAFKTVFTTKARHAGAALGGLAGADAICNQAAAAVELPGTFKAWLSDIHTSAASRVTHATVPYKTVNGVRVAANFAELISGGLRHEIDRDERGEPIPFDFSDFGSSQTWTNTRPDGSQIPYDPSNPDPTENPRLDCGGWVTGAVGGIGSFTELDGNWTGGSGGLDCGALAHLYCLEQ